MNKKVWVGAIIVFVVMVATDFLVHTVLLASTYQSIMDSGSSPFRSPEDSKVYIFFITRAFQAFLFALVFSKGYEAKGMAEGIRYGIYMGVFLTVGTAYGQYALFPLPYNLAMMWFLYEVVQWIIAGVLIAQYWGMKPKAQMS
ncbi:MAG: hypothetical protein L0Y80_13380 [Ignavibacteriae bacterium]|nr:hypothetical protein [Ignavibacteriota bacterium]